MLLAAAKLAFHSTLQVVYNTTTVATLSFQTTFLTIVPDFEIQANDLICSAHELPLNTYAVYVLTIWKYWK